MPLASHPQTARVIRTPSAAGTAAEVSGVGLFSGGQTTVRIGPRRRPENGPGGGLQGGPEGEPGEGPGSGPSGGAEGGFVFVGPTAETGATPRANGRPRAVRADVDHLWRGAIHPAFERIPPRHTVLGVVADRDGDGAGPTAQAGGGADQGSGGGAGIVAATVEHLLGALELLGLSSAEVRLVGGAEVPILDGSALPFFEVLAEQVEPAAAGDLGVGTFFRDSLEPLVVREPLTVDDGRGGSVTIEPHDGLVLRYELDYSGAAGGGVGGGSGPGPAIAAHTAEIDLIGASLDERRRIASARTFSLASEAAQMRAVGLFTAFTPRDLLVIDDTPEGRDRGTFGEPIDNAWRFEGEPAAHKLLDLIGDLSLVGRPLRGRVVARRSGHALHHLAAAAIVAATE